MLCAILSIWGCVNDNAPLTPAANGNGAISFRILIAADSPFRKIARSAELEVTGPEMNPIRQALRITDSTVEGKVEGIAAGPDRNFLATVFDSAGSECYRGSAKGDIRKDSTTRINLKLSRNTGTAIINGSIDEGVVIPLGPFGKDSNTIFLADFNGNLKDQVSGGSGLVTGGSFAEGLFGKGLRFDSTLNPKAVCRFPNSDLLSTEAGSIEALVNLKGKSTDFMHIVDKSWLYGLTIFNGSVAVDFGTIWWYSDYRMPVDKWTYLCASFDGEIIRLYANGELVDSAAYVRTNGQRSWGLGIGNAEDNSFNIPFLGTIDEVRISKGARPVSDIRAAWNAISAKTASL
ncbi:MAG: LamG domain-containing protein [Fibrobacteria bacterium]